MATWYQKNREKSLEQAKTWRLNNLDRYRQYQNDYRKRKRAAKKAEKAQSKPKMVWIPPPEGWDPFFDPNLRDWCLKHGVPYDPNYGQLIEIKSDSD